MEQSNCCLIYEANVAFLIISEEDGKTYERSHIVQFTAESDDKAIKSLQRWTVSRKATGMFGPVSGVKLHRKEIGPIDEKGNIHYAFLGFDIVDWKCDRGSYKDPSLTF